MKIYLELIEISESEEADFIRIDITDWNDEDINTAIELLKEHASNYEVYVIQKHMCLHDAGGSCVSEIYGSRGI